MTKKWKQRKIDEYKNMFLGKIFGHFKIISYLGSHNKRKWLVRCMNCQNETIRQTQYINQQYLNKTPRCLNCCGMSQGQSGLNKLFSSYKMNAEKTNRKFTLTINEFMKITSSNCHYCNIKPLQASLCGSKNKTTNWGDYYYNGVDRKDNSKDYISGNCLSCCKKCNFAKGNMEYQEFVEWIKQLRDG